MTQNGLGYEIDNLLRRVHSLLPRGVKEPSLDDESRPTDATLLKAGKVKALLIVNRDDRVGPQTAARIYGRLSAAWPKLFPAQFNRKTAGARVRCLCLVLVREGYPVVGTPKGIYVAEDDATIDAAARHLIRLARGNLNAARDLLRTSPIRRAFP